MRWHRGMVQEKKRVAAADYRVQVQTAQIARGAAQSSHGIGGAVPITGPGLSMDHGLVHARRRLTFWWFPRGRLRRPDAKNPNNYRIHSFRLIQRSPNQNIGAYIKNA